jgi:molybdopterin synthase sulfur carrier subunit
MNVTVKLFAIAADLANSQTAEVDLTDDTVAALRRALAEKYPALARVLPHFLFAINSQYATDASKIPADADIACIPPVSGG